MITVSSAVFQRNFGAYQDKALVEPVAITRSGWERIVVLSADEYHRLKRRDQYRAGFPARAPSGRTTVAGVGRAV
jgi:PHD/YefM family antitoxin component YafN of YafNO toxin-antitoxin module